MIIIKGENEQALVARIEKELKGEEVDIFQSDEGYTMEEIAANLADSAKRTRVAVGRIERNTRKQHEEARELNELMLPVALYFAALVEEMYPRGTLPVQIQRILTSRKNAEIRGTRRVAEVETTPSKLKLDFEVQKEIATKLREEGKSPKE